ncbi:hypothetical protein DKX38_028470 [Salix brachista]|uniref:Uncharacterized protein n=1 Tax=Salix brachista TaxID=2182728 RepID=A0A5N5J9C8_9ROSI|nr:hypothetical protein DKX38_028470 [Salix brachista]
MASTSQPHSPSSSSLKQKLKSTLCLSSFHKHHHHHHHHHRFTISNSEKHIQQKHDRHVVQEVVNVDSREGFLSCVGKHGHRRRHSMSANFHYDATSYALNFDEVGEAGVAAENGADEGTQEHQATQAENELEHGDIGLENGLEPGLENVYSGLENGAEESDNTGLESVGEEAEGRIPS